MVSVGIGSSDPFQIDQAAVDFAGGPTKHTARTNYTPFDQYDWLFLLGAGLYNGAFPGIKFGVTSTGGAFFDPYCGISALVLSFPESDDEPDFSYDEAPDSAFWILGLIPEAGVRLNYPFSDKLKLFASLSWSVPMTVADYGAAISLTTQVALGAFFY